MSYYFVTMNISNNILIENTLKKYVKFNLSTFQGRMTVGFVLVGLIVLLLVFYPIYVYRGSLRQYQDLTHSAIPTKYTCMWVENILNQSTVALNNFLLTDDHTYQYERKRIWQEDYKSAIDSLLYYSNTINDAGTSALIYDFIVKANELRAKQDYFEKEHANSIEKDIRKISIETELNPDKLKLLRNEQMRQVQELLDQAEFLLHRVTTSQADMVRRVQGKTKSEEKNIVIVSAMLLVIILTLTFTVGYFVIRFVLKRIATLKKRLEQIDDGNLPEYEQTPEDELKPISAAINLLTKNLSEVKNFALQVGKGNFDSEFTAFDKDSDVGNALIKMRESLKAVSIEERKRAWTINGLAHFANILRNKSNDLNLLCEVVIIELVKYIDAHQGAIYTVSDDTVEDHRRLLLKSWYAFERRKYRERTVEIGEGVLGEAYREKRTVYMKRIPEDYLKITSGLGDAEPSCLLIVPLKVNEEVEGMIEIASFKVLEPYEIDFVEKICENVASTIISVKINEKTKQLLENAQLSAEMMRAQEEEMRQNMEELQATQEAFHRREAELMEQLKQVQEEEQTLLIKVKELENRLIEEKERRGTRLL